MILTSCSGRSFGICRLRALLFVLGWALFALVLHNVATTIVEEKGPWDPYVILNVDSVSVVRPV
jgi:preprotein translocase subunit Sec63